jgi:LysR family transcriptional regulator, carnitine catabolism transcriptional activator
MTGRQLRAFVALADTLNFAMAAERIHMSQPALSLAIKSLERGLGGRLLTRTTRRVALTPEGELLVPLARRMLAEWDDTEEMLRHRFTLQRGHVAIAAMPSFAGNVLPELLVAYRRHYPRVDVAIHDVIHEHVLDFVDKGRVELGISFEPDSTEHFQFEPLFIDRFVAAIPRQRPFAGMRKIAWKQLLSHPFVTLQRPSTVRRLLERSLALSGIELKVAMECHQLASVAGLVASGLGVSAVPALCARQMNLLGARSVPLHSPTIERAVGLITRRQAVLSTAALAMYDIALARFRKGTSLRA